MATLFKVDPENCTKAESMSIADLIKEIVMHPGDPNYLPFRMEYTTKTCKLAESNKDPKAALDMLRVVS